MSVDEQEQRKQLLEYSSQLCDVIAINNNTGQIMQEQNELLGSIESPFSNAASSASSTTQSTTSSGPTIFMQPQPINLAAQKAIDRGQHTAELARNARDHRKNARSFNNAAENLEQQMSWTNYLIGCCGLWDCCVAEWCDDESSEGERQRLTR